MVVRGSGKILQLASIAAKTSTPYMAVYGGTKAFIYNFTQALISELKDSKVSVTALLPGPTDTNFFTTAGAEKTVIVVEGDLDDPTAVAKSGYEAMQSGESKIVAGWKNKVQAGIGNLLSDEMLADQSKKQNEISSKR